MTRRAWHGTGLLPAALALAWFAAALPAAAQTEVDIPLAGIEDVATGDEELLQQLDEAAEGDHREFKVVTDEDVGGLAVGDIYKSNQSFFKVKAIRRKGPDGGAFTVERMGGKMDPGMKWSRVSGEGPLLIGSRETMLERFMKGGVVMYPIALLLLVMLVVTVRSATYYREKLHCPADFLEECRRAVADGDIARFEELSLARRGLLAHTCRVMVANLRRLTVAEIKSRVEAAAVHEVGRMNFPLRILNFVTVAAPLLGLLGTVSGMIVCFDSLAGEAATQSKAMAMAAGIKEALLTTFFGLTVAVPSLLVFFVFNYRVTQIANLCAVGAEELIHEIALLRRESLPGAGPGPDAVERAGLEDAGTPPSASGAFS